MQMKGKPLLIISFLLVIFSTASVWAQSQEGVEPFISAFTQSVVRNPEGILLVYQENFAVRIANPVVFNTFLDQQMESGAVKVTKIDNFGEIQEMIEINTTQAFETDELRAWDAIGGRIGDESYRFATIFHEGYPVSDGDVLTITWVFFRTLE